MTIQGYRIVTGTAEAAQGAADAEVIAAITGKTLRLMKAVVSVTVVAASAGGEVALEDGVGGTRFFEADADALGVYRLDFGSEGYPLTSGTKLNLTVDGSGGNQATARCTAVCKVV